MIGYYDDFEEALEDYYRPSARPDHYFLQAQQDIKDLYETIKKVFTT